MGHLTGPTYTGPWISSQTDKSYLVVRGPHGHCEFIALTLFAVPELQVVVFLTSLD